MSRDFLSSSDASISDLSSCSALIFFLMKLIPDLRELLVPEISQNLIDTTWSITDGDFVVRKW